jgi:hypothetical protein
MDEDHGRVMRLVWDAAAVSIGELANRLLELKGIDVNTCHDCGDGFLVEVE